MMHGHNRPPFPPKLPGTATNCWDVPAAIIYRPARAATVSAPRPDYWVLEFAPSRAPQVEPLMGHTASEDPFRTIRLRFPDRESAVDFAERHDWRYILREDRPAPPLSPRGGGAHGIASSRGPMRPACLAQAHVPAGGATIPPDDAACPEAGHGQLFDKQQKKIS